MLVVALRSVGGVVAGLFISILLIIAVEVFSEVVHPMPEGFTATHDEIAQHVQRYPAWVLAVVVPAWGFAAFAGVWTAGRLGNCWSALAVGLVLLAGIIVNVSLLPYPIWFKIAAILAVLISIAGWYRLRGTAVRTPSQ